jgi:hypothetical protein
VGKGRLELAQQVFLKNHLKGHEATGVDQCDPEDSSFNLGYGIAKEQQSLIAKTVERHLTGRT